MLAASKMLKHLVLGVLDTMKVVLAAAAMAEAMTAEDNIMGKVNRMPVGVVAGSSIPQLVLDLKWGTTIALWWTLDQPTTTSLTDPSSIISNLLHMDRKGVIQMPNGMVEPILGTGSVYVEVRTPCGGDDTIILRDVQWAPGLKFNLLSENTAKYEGARFEDSKGGGKLLYKPGEAIPSVLCELHKNVHVMKCKPIPVEPAELAQQSMVLLSGATASEVKQYEAERLHRALGHPGNSALVKTLEGHVEGTSVTPEAVKQLGSCEQCLAGKQTRNPFPDFGRATDWKLGELIVFDLFVAPANVVSQHGYKYQLTAVDYYSRYCLVSFLSHKNEAFNHMKRVHKFVERQTGNNTKCFRTNRGNEFPNNDVVDYCNELGIQFELTTTYTSQQNGLVERMHLTIFNKVRAMLVDSGIDKQHWAEAAGTAAYVYNRTASLATPRGKTPFECYLSKKPDISNLRPFGDVAMVMTMPRYARDGKMGPGSVKGRLMGYSKCSKAWRVLLPTGLHGNSPTALPATSSYPPPPQLPQHEQDSDSSGSDEVSSTESDFSQDEGDTPHQGQPTVEGATAEESVTLRAADDALKVDWFRGERAGQHPIPQTMDQMRKHPYHKGYEDAIIVEMESIKARGVLEPVRWERGLKVIDTKVVFDEKVDDKGLITSLKARLVAKGLRQSKGKDYTEIWAAVSKHSSLRAVLAVAAAKDWILHQVDVKTAFLHANLDEELYVRVPADLLGGGGTFRLRKAIFGLKQASRAWYKHLKGIMEGMGFHQSTADPTLQGAC
ncbi:hypothetical protein CEUSTIGMA_g399.t1 [Chlamydomonas eustigma]|uniref:Integrase catalytic domain-containing protein n=1 Tax=Chlamydomonas eustigma TaxID=1157962 RepID=A0A250WQ14_9CHLO|nr:hypothetical protein CEUSTIGMA_g399.t1 [Chlamydomonas eustigma]|eukprot:GAX72944.1 hypothetical protein CEUSTIGMA_g399.t1 [Chlamydomonas eustigma]